MSTCQATSAESSRPLRVLHVSPTDIVGGAALGAYGVHRALLKTGIDSLMLVQRKYSDDPSVITQGRGISRAVEALRDRIDRIPLHMQARRPDAWWTVGLLPINVRSMVRRLKPDLLQFHWAGRGAGPIETIRDLRDVPIVWTLRDMWPLTGGCHYSAGCQRFLTGCGVCPQIGSVKAADLSSWQWKRKYRAWRHLDVTFLALSRWMASYARQSPLAYNKTVSVIPNGIDTGTFRPKDKAAARQIWNLPADRKVVMFGALFGTKDPRKGFNYLCDALRLLAEKGAAKDLLAVVFGAEDGPETGVETRYVGTIHNRAALADLYACADVMVLPSLEENFGKTTLESMACGVPTVAFANSGQLDIIDHQINGYLAEDRSAEDLARGIVWCLDPDRGPRGLGRLARAKVKENFDIDVVAKKHVALYEELLHKRRFAGSVVLADEIEDATSKSGSFVGATPRPRGSTA